MRRIGIIFVLGAALAACTPGGSVDGTELGNAGKFDRAGAVINLSDDTTQTMFLRCEEARGCDIEFDVTLRRPAACDLFPDDRSCGVGIACEHSVCVPGAPLDPSCSTCAQKVCEADSFCCDNEWDAICAQFAPALCGEDPVDLCYENFNQVATFGFVNPDGRTHKSNVVVASTDGRNFGAFVEQGSFQAQEPGTYFVEVKRNPDLGQNVELVVEANWDEVPPVDAGAAPDAAPVPDADGGVPPPAPDAAPAPIPDAAVPPTADAGPAPVPDAAL